jgi:probable HAF family extracellular repeat protein
MRKIAFFTLLVATSTLVWGSPIYTATDIGTLPGGSWAQATAINNSGQIAGYGATSSGAVEAFLYGGGSITGLGFVSGTTNSYAYGLNNLGDVVGTAINPATGLVSAYLYTGGTMNGFMTGTVADGLTEVTAMDVNDSRQIAGYYVTGGGTMPRPYIYDACVGSDGSFQGAYSWTEWFSAMRAYSINNGGYAAMDWTWTAGRSQAMIIDEHGTRINIGQRYSGSSNHARGINDSNQVAGYETFASGLSVPFLYSDGLYTFLGFLPGAGDGQALGLNNRGQVVGFEHFFGGNYDVAFLYSDGVLMDLNGLVQSLPTGVSLRSATAINDSGQIAALGTDGHSYLLEPVPEPASLGLAGAGLLGQFVWSRKRRAGLRS